VSDDQTRPTEVTAQPVDIQHGWLYRRTVLPILTLLRQGASPERLAWSIAAGVVIGINPLLGTTTLLCLAVAAIFRLNIAASQVANHAIYPIQLLLFVPFLDLGARVFGTEKLLLKPSIIMGMAKSHPLNLVRTLWQWEWHALVLWAVFALFGIPLIALATTPVLRRLLDRIKRRQYPIVAAG
jgi:uncharacterized protein (DUF2062 family)